MNSAKLHDYYTDAAPLYGAVDRVFSGLAEALVTFAQPQGLTLDLGSGWGAVTRQVTTPCIGLDFIHTMCSLAAGRTPFVTGDMHALPFAAHTFDTLLAQFAFNSTQPEQSFVEARRVLRQGGRLTLHEWGDIDPLSEAVADTFAEYTLTDPPATLADYRQQMQTPIAWDALGGLSDLVKVVEASGFEVITCTTVEIGVRVRAADFVRYKLAWPARQREMIAMADGLAALCEAELTELVESYAAPDGLVLWEPDIVRLQAR